MMVKPKQEVCKCCWLFLVTLIFILSCGDSLNITGITETNETGYEPIGKIDENDWCPPEQGTAQTGLFPAYPNPANDSTWIEMQISQRSFVKLQIINRDKRVVKLLIDNRPFAAGRYARRWNLDNDNGERVKNGFYRVQLTLDDELICYGDIQVKNRD